MTAGHPCSLACLIMICSLEDVNIKKITDEIDFFRYSGLELQAQSAVMMLNMQTKCSSKLSAGKKQRAYCPLLIVDCSDHIKVLYNILYIHSCSIL